MADRSEAGEEGHVDSILPAEPKDLRRVDRRPDQPGEVELGQLPHVQPDDRVDLRVG